MNAIIIAIPAEIETAIFTSSWRMGVVLPTTYSPLTAKTMEINKFEITEAIH